MSDEALLEAYNQSVLSARALFLKCASLIAESKADAAEARKMMESLFDELIAPMMVCLDRSKKKFDQSAQELEASIAALGAKTRQLEEAIKEMDEEGEDWKRGNPELET